ncbi:MAG: ABC transporter permease [Lachnospiraceae bacterium]|nr:ABC transporter permease [Lachnospiraceae bacterium]
MKKRQNRSIYLMLIPIYAFTIIFVLFPILYMILLSFLSKAEVWGVVKEVTLDNYKKIAEPLYVKTFLDSIRLAAISTGFVALLGYPFGYFMAKLSKKWKKRMMELIMIPFWTSGLMRLYGWIIVFRSNGTLDQVLMGLHITGSPLKLLYSYQAVVVGMIYALMPFMVLSVYSSAEKMDWTLVEAARDLGATKFKAFLTITLKQTMPGLLSGVILTFVPSMGMFFVSDLLGGNKIVLVGSVIQEQLTKGRNLPFAASMSVVLMLLTTMLISLYKRVTGSGEMEGLV